MGLMDQVCPPSTVFAAYNYWGGADNDIRIYRYMQLDSVSYQKIKQLKFVKSQWG